MTNIELDYIGVLDETNQLFIFTKKIGKESYGVHVIVNMALPIQIQDSELVKTIEKTKKLTMTTIKEVEFEN